MTTSTSWRRGGAALAAFLVAGATLATGTRAALADPATAPCTPYQLPGLPGGNGDGNVMWITDNGLYVGASTGADGNVHATWWTHTGADLATGWIIHTVPLPADNTEVLDVNRNGVMVGSDDDTGQSWVYDSQHGTLTWLPDLPGGSWNFGRRISTTGEVAGSADNQRGVGLATIWKPPYTSAYKLPDAGAGQSVGTQAGAHLTTFDEADGVNDSGTVVGDTTLGGHTQDTWYAARNGFWRDGLAPLIQAIEWHPNGQVDRLPAGLTQGQGFAINNAGTVVGAADFAGQQAWLAPAYWQDGQLHDMGAPADVLYGIARGISSGGWASGQILFPYGDRGFVWTGSGKLLPLPMLPGFTESNAHAVNDVRRQTGGDSWNDTSDVATVWQCPTGFTTG